MEVVQRGVLGGSGTGAVPDSGLSDFIEKHAFGCGVVGKAVSM